jgi:phosphoglycolate phosphatase
MPPTTEPFNVLRHVARHRPADAARAEAELARLETEAVGTAEPTPGATDVLRHFAATDRPVIVVSNNSAAAIRAYLDRHDLGRYVADGSARTASAPDLLKPNPHLLNEAVDILGAPARKCVMIGDSDTDIKAAQAAGLPVIAYANKLGKLEFLSVLQPNATIVDMRELIAECR